MYLQSAMEEILQERKTIGKTEKRQKENEANRKCGYTTRSFFKCFKTG